MGRRRGARHDVLIGEFLALAHVRLGPVAAVPVHVVSDLVVEEVLDVEVIE